MRSNNPVAEFTDPWLGDKVNSNIRLEYRPANHVAWRAITTTLPGGPVQQPYVVVDFIPQSGICEFGYWVYPSIPRHSGFRGGRQMNECWIMCKKLKKNILFREKNLSTRTTPGYKYLRHVLAYSCIRITQPGPIVIKKDDEPLLNLTATQERRYLCVHKRGN